MSRSSSAVVQGPGRVSGGGIPAGALMSAGGPEGDRLRADGSDRSPQDEMPPIGDLQLVLVTARGFEMPLVTSPAQAARLLRSSGEADAADQRSDGDPGIPRPARQSVRDAPRGLCGMKRTPSSRQRLNGDGRLAGTTRDGVRSRSRDERNCAQWFARFEERREEPTGRPSHSEVRRLRKELEALRRLVTGEQIP